MIGDLFDSPWKILIVAAVILVLFGSAKLPAAARSLGKSMRILKTEIKDLHEDETAPAAVAPAQLPTPVPVPVAVPVPPAAEVPVAVPVPAAPPQAMAPELITAQQLAVQQAGHGAAS